MERLLWQKAILKTNEGSIDNDGPVNSTFWTIGEPFITSLPGWERNTILTNVMFPNYIVGHVDELRPVDIEAIELLPEFAEDVPIITWEEFINGNV